MLFKDYHLPMIRSGSKTVTRREWAENYAGPNVGTIVAAKTEMLKPDVECDCFIEITGKRREPLGETTDESARREGDYDDVEDFRAGYEEVYGEGSWDPEKVVDVIEFEYVGDERPPADPEQSELGSVRCWDNEDCPRDGCEGELQQQDRINVMCLSCDEVFAHYKNDDNHILADSSDETVARKARMLPDGGTDEDAGTVDRLSLIGRALAAVGLKNHPDDCDHRWRPQSVMRPSRSSGPGRRHMVVDRVYWSCRRCPAIADDDPREVAR